MNWLVSWLLILCLPWMVEAKHIIGGELSIKSLPDKPGHILIGMNQFWEDYNPYSGEADVFLQVHIFRKQNPVKMATYYLDRNTLPTLLPYDNEACAKDKKLKTYLAQFYGDPILDPAKYDDPGGYYVVWERCCRSNTISNMAGTDVGMMFYAEFPPLSQNGTLIVNSTPQFITPRGNYICLNKTFTMSFAANDADGDELRYSLVTPYRGYTTASTLWDNNGTVRTSYPLINWASGYSATNAIPGEPALSIDNKTGLLLVKATQTGNFLFTVQCDEYRMGKKIGSVRRDMMLPVIDCPKNAPPLPIISLNGVPTQDAKLCIGTSLTLTTDQNPDWAYQWSRDGAAIDDANAAWLSVNDVGTYTISKTFSKTCASESKSEETKVQVIPQPTAALKLLTLDGAREIQSMLCEGDQAQLVVSVASTGEQYQWSVGETKIATVTDRIQVSNSGLYSLTVTPIGANCSASVNRQVDFRPRPLATLTASATQVCEGKTTLLLAATGSGYTYRWEPADPTSSSATSSREVNQPGGYRVTITNTDGCSAVSPTLSISFLPKPTLAVDPVAPLCSNTAAVALTAQPGTGTWKGRGMDRGLFNPRLAGVGSHTLTYTVVDPHGCEAMTNLVVAVTSCASNQLYIPTAFSPNQDGQNDTWQVVNSEDCSSCEVLIYNRWGEVIYAQSGPSIRWDGMYKTRIVEAGLYSYVLKTDTSGGHVYRGQITVIR